VTPVRWRVETVTARRSEHLAVVPLDEEAAAETAWRRSPKTLCGRRTAAGRHCEVCLFRLAALVTYSELVVSGRLVRAKDKERRTEMGALEDQARARMTGTQTVGLSREEITANVRRGADTRKDEWPEAAATWNPAAKTLLDASQSG
jgi:hypothetical protein